MPVNKKSILHLRSRLQVEKILSSGKYGLTTLRAGIIVGSGSASFEIIRDLVEKLPGEAWLEFRIINSRLLQTATFRQFIASGISAAITGSLSIAFTLSRIITEI